MNDWGETRTVEVSEERDNEISQLKHLITNAKLEPEPDNYVEYT